MHLSLEKTSPLEILTAPIIGSDPCQTNLWSHWDELGMNKAGPFTTVLNISPFSTQMSCVEARNKHEARYLLYIGR